MEIKNYTGELARAEAFIHAKCALISTEGLSVHIKYTRAKRRDVVGYYRFADRRIVIAVKKRLRYPRRAAYGVGSVALAKKPVRGRPFKLVWHEDRFDSPDDLLAFVAGHEIWHFLCHSGQRKGNHETKANRNGFLWLKEFQRWAGPGARVEPVPPLPPRPDAATPQTSMPMIAAARAVRPAIAALRSLARRPSIGASPSSFAKPSRAAGESREARASRGGAAALRSRASSRATRPTASTHPAAPSSALRASVGALTQPARAWIQEELFSVAAAVGALVLRPRSSPPRRGRRPRTR